MLNNVEEEENFVLKRKSGPKEAEENQSIMNVNNGQISSDV